MLWIPQSQGIIKAPGIPIGGGGGGVTPPVDPPPGGGSGTTMKLLGHGDWTMLENLMPTRDLDGILWYSSNASWGAATSGAGTAPSSPVKKYNMTTLRTWLPEHEIAGSNPNVVTLHQRVANGEFDSYLTQQANAIAAHTPDCYLSTFNEFNGDWFPQYAGWNPTVWIQMFRHVAVLCKNANSRFKIVWAPSWQFMPTWGNGNPNAPTDLASYWPGDDVVDFVGLDWYYGQGNTLDEVWNASMSHVWGAKSISDFGAARNKRAVYPEWGLWSVDSPDWITRCFNFFNETNAEAVCYFNIDWDGAHHLGQHPNSAARYGALFTTVPPVTEVPVPPTPSTPGRLYVDNHIHRYSDTGSPFLWMADTFWTAWHRQPSDFSNYCVTRKNQGFSVIQVFCYVANSYWPDAYRRAYDGSYPFNGGNPLSWNASYWNIMKNCAQVAAANNLFFCLMIGCPGRSEEDWKLYGTSDAYNWGYKIGEHFRGMNNMMFGLTLDRHADYNDHWGISEFRAEAEGLANGWNNSGTPNYSTLFITLHPNGDSRSTSAYWHNEPSNYMNAHQEWGAMQNVYNTSIADYWKTPYKPSAMVEGCYESYGGTDYGFQITPLMINQQAMHCFFAGVGNTYAFWEHWFDVSEYNAPGAQNMARIGSWIRSRPWHTWTPDQSIFVSGEGSGTTRKVAVRNPDSLTWHVYFPNGSGSATLSLDKLGSGASVTGTWWNPSNDETSGAWTYSGNHAYTCPYSDGILTLTR